MGKEMEYHNLVVSREGQVARISINHPPANTWNLATMCEFETVVYNLERDRDVRVVVITGTGEKCFSAGFDVTDAANAIAISEKGRAVWSRLDRFPKPVIAGINGHALGGGLELAIACHLRLVADRPEIKLGLTELNLGIMPGWGGTQRLPRLIGRQKALQMILLSTTLEPAEAFKIGLVDYLCKPEEFDSFLNELARRLAERPPVAVRCTLEAMSAGRYEGMAKGLESEAQGSAIVRQTEDRDEGFRAFMEKRKPTFTGR